MMHKNIQIEVEPSLLEKGQTRAEVLDEYINGHPLINEAKTHNVP